MPTSPSPTPPLPSGFLGRADELLQIRAQFESVADQRRPGMMVLVGDSGSGKTRLAQALYQQLTIDPVWDPAASNYWPDAFQAPSEALRVNPEFDGHSPAGLPRFLWLGARWFNPDRPLEDRACPLPSVLDQLAHHQERCSSLGSIWKHLANEASDRVAGIAREGGIETALEWTGIPGLRLALEGADVAQTVIRSRWRESRSDDRLARESVNAGRRLNRALKAVLTTANPTPVILFLDDAQWIDPVTASTLGELLDQAIKGRWPLLVLATHHALDWHQGLRFDRRQGARSLAYFAEIDLGTGRRPEILELSSGEDVAGFILDDRLPGLRPEQRTAILGKSANSLHALARNIRSLESVSHHFIDRNPSGPLSELGIKAVDQWRDDARDRATQRFLELPEPIKDALAWGAGLGRRFMLEIVERFAHRRSAEITDLLDQEPVLTTPGPGVREFRDRLDFDAATEYLANYLPTDAAALREFFDEIVLTTRDAFAQDGALRPDHELRGVGDDRETSVLADLDTADRIDFLDAVTIVMLGSDDRSDLHDQHASIAVRSVGVVLEHRAAAGDTAAVATVAGRLNRWDQRTPVHAHLGVSRRQHLAELLIAFDELNAAETLIPSPTDASTKTEPSQDARDRMLLADILRRQGRVDEALAMVGPLRVPPAATDADCEWLPESDLYRLLAAIHEQRGDYLHARDAIARSFELMDRIDPTADGILAAERSMRLGTLSIYGEELDVASGQIQSVVTISNALIRENQNDEHAALLLARATVLLADIEHRKNGPSDKFRQLANDGESLLRDGFDKFGPESWLEPLTSVLEQHALCEMFNYRVAESARQFLQVVDFIEHAAGNLGTPLLQARMIRCRAWVALRRGGYSAYTLGMRPIGIRARPALRVLVDLEKQLDLIAELIPESERFRTRCHLHLTRAFLLLSLAGRSRKKRAALHMQAAHAAATELAVKEPQPENQVLRAVCGLLADWLEDVSRRRLGFLLSQMFPRQNTYSTDPIDTILRYPALSSTYWLRNAISLIAGMSADSIASDETWKSNANTRELLVQLTDLQSRCLDRESHFLATMAGPWFLGFFDPSEDNPFSEDQRKRLQAATERTWAAFAPRQRLKRWVRSWFGR